ADDAHGVAREEDGRHGVAGRAPRVEQLEWRVREYWNSEERIRDAERLRLRAVSPYDVSPRRGGAERKPSLDGTIGNRGAVGLTSSNHGGRRLSAGQRDVILQSKHAQPDARDGLADESRWGGGELSEG